MDVAQQTAGNSTQKLTVEKFVDQGVACFKLAGWIDEDFDGKKLAQTIHARTLVLHLAEIRRISSFGIREWVDFIAAAARVTDAIVLVECAPKVVDQLNMVGNFIGPGRVFSFYAPYRCDYCDSEDRVLMQVDRDWDTIKSMQPPERQCASCGDVTYFDEDPVTYFSHIASLGRFELDPAITALLSSKLSHPVSDTTQRLRVDKSIEDRYTYLKLSGDLDTTFPRSKLAEGLEGIIVIDLTSLGRVEPAGAAEWRSFIQTLTPAAEAIYLLAVPPTFLEKLTSRDDLGPRAQVLTIALPYACSSCATTAPHVLDVVQQYDVLKFATAPEEKCADCKAATYCSASESLLSHLPSLPKPSITPEVRKFIKAMKDRKPGERRAAIMTPVPDAGASLTSLPRRSIWPAVAIAAVLAALVTAGGLFGYRYLEGRGRGPVSPDGVGAMLEASAPARPPWVTVEIPFTSSCSTGAELGMSCVGVSSYSASEADARTEAQDAGLEAIVHALAPRVAEPEWSRVVAPIYSDMRQAKLSLLAEATDRTSMQYDRAFRNVRDGRRAVARVLAKTAGSALPPAPTSTYWERYEAASGAGYRYLVFVQYELSADRIDQLIELYTRPVEAGATRVLTVFPGMAWRYPDIDHGVVITHVSDGVLKTMGLTERYIVLSIQDRVIKDAPAFGRILTQELADLAGAGGDLRLQVKTGDNAPMEFNRPIPKAGATPPTSGPSSPGSRPSSGKLPGPVNTWDRVGGDSRDNPEN